jgi:hypothetical protein
MECHPLWSVYRRITCHKRWVRARVTPVGGVGRLTGWAPSCDVSAAGPKAAAKNALIGGVVLAMIEGASIAITKVRVPNQVRG